MAEIVQINMQKIPVGRGLGAAALIAVVLVGMFADLPGVRGTVVGGGTLGLALGVSLIWWRRRHIAADVHPTLGITGH